MSGATASHLPNEVLVIIFSFLPAQDIGTVASVCSRWWQVAKNRQVWRSKGFLAEGDRELSDALPIARALPVVKRVSVRWGGDLNVYLSAELADFVVPDLRDETVTSAISSLVTESLSVEICLLKEKCSNFLVVQLHELKQLQICASRRMSVRDDVAPTLWALADTLSREPPCHLQSVDICTARYLKVGKVGSDILGTLSTCSSLEQLTIRTRCFLSCRTVTEFSKLQFLQLGDCKIEDISFLEFCPNLRSLSLDRCSVLGRPKLSHVSELRSLVLRRLSVKTKFVAALCDASPNLEAFTVAECPRVVNTLFLRHCPQLSFVEVNKCGNRLIHVASLPPALRHLRLHLPLVKSDYLAEILQDIPRLEILDVFHCYVQSLRFLRHCSGLTELSLVCSSTYQHFDELGGLRGLKKLHLHYNHTDFGPLADALSKLNQLESLVLLFTWRVSNFSFLRYCQQLRCLTIKPLCSLDRDDSFIHELSNLKELRKLVFESLLFRVEELESFLPDMPHLEELCVGLVGTESNFSFLRHCGQLVSLQFSSVDVGGTPRFTELRNLRCLRRLTVRGLMKKYRQLLAEEVVRLPKLEYLGLTKNGPNVLESWEWHKMLSSLRWSAESKSNLKETS